MPDDLVATRSDVADVVVDFKLVGHLYEQGWASDLLVGASGHLSNQLAEDTDLDLVEAHLVEVENGSDCPSQHLARSQQKSPIKGVNVRLLDCDPDAVLAVSP